MPASGLLFGLGLYCIGVPNPALWGVVAAILRYVPYVGTLVAATLPLALSLAVFDGWLRPLLVFLLVASLELIVANFVEPWLYGAHVGISSLALLVTRRLLDRFVGTRGPDPVYPSDRLRRGSGPLFPATLVSAHPAGR